MKQNQYYTAIGLGGLCAVLGLALLILGSSARSLQSDLQTAQAQFQTQQDQINTGVTISKQVIPNLFQDLSAHPENVGIKTLLSKHGAAPGPGQ